MKVTLFLIFSLTALSARAQFPDYAYSYYSDHFGEWVLTTDSTEGYLKRTFSLGDNWEDWEYVYEGYTGSITHQFSTRWRVIGSEQVQMQPIWPGDTRYWRLYAEDMAVKLSTIYGNIRDQWILDAGSHGEIYFYTYYESDPRDWIIDSYLTHDIPFEIKMAALFLVIYYSTPRL